MPPASSAMDTRRSSNLSGSSSTMVAAATAALAASTSTSNSSPSLPRTKALADAVAGVLASLVSLWCFYPFEIWKLQAQTASSISTPAVGHQRQQPQHQQRLDVDDDDDIILDLQSTLVSPPPAPPPPRKDQGIPAKEAISSWSRHEQLAPHRLCKWPSSLFAGLVPKSVHTAASSFCYFYLYSWIVAIYQQYRLQRRIRRRGVPTAASSSTAAIAPTTRLILSALAALINTFLTLPMDVISTQYQLQGSGGTGSTPTTDDNEEDDTGTETYIFYDASGSSDEEDESNTSTYNLQPQQHQFGFSMDESILTVSNDCDDERHDENQANDERQKLDRDHDNDYCPQAASMHSGQAIGTAHQIQSALVRLRSYWKGLLPSLLLCSNPAIHFTVYDVTKVWYLSSSHIRVVAQKQSRQKKRLGLIESFLLGLIAKFVATMATYPLIQAKVRLMSSLHNDTATNSSGSGSRHGISTLWSCLCHDFNDAGLAGLYRGCHLQLLHTLLKTALVMMLRERIEHSTRQWLLMPTPPVSER